MPNLLLEGPFESNYSLAIVNRGLAGGLLDAGVCPALHQRDNTTHYFPGEPFLQRHSRLAPLFERDIDRASFDVHSRYIYPPYTDGFRGTLRFVHCYGWEESVFPAQFVEWFNRDVDLVTVMSDFVRKILLESGVLPPVHVVGLGADHILHEPAKPVSWFPADEFVFLHVSSCFPRKAPEVLTRAFCEEFTREPVRLVIKTFANPHNDVARIVREMDAEYPNHAPVDVIIEPLTPAEMRFLYERAGCLVSPSRGEGFGLPVAEAMLVGCPVIATIYSGQADICKEDHCWPVDYRLEAASTHLTEGNSVWANPVVGSLREQMRAVYRSPATERARRSQSARDFVAARFTWQQVAVRHWRHCQAMLEKTGKPLPAQPHPNRPLAIGFVTSWNTRCGIAEYSRHLAEHLPEPARFSIFANRVSETLTRADEPFVRRCWTAFPGENNQERVEELVRAIVGSGVDAVSVQYNFGFFSPRQLDWLIEGLNRHSIPTAVTLHAVRHETFPQLKSPLSKAALVICHQPSNVEAVRSLGVTDVLLRRQGIVSSQLGKPRRKPTFTFTVSCFGFFLPPKGIFQLLQAFALALTIQPLMRLKLLNAIYPVPESSSYARACFEHIQQNGLAPYVSVTTAFLEHEAILQELAASDLVVLPYLHSTESSSAAGAFAVASMTPVLTSDLPIFDELGEAVHRVPAGDVPALARKLLDLAANPAELDHCRGPQERLVRELGWPVVAADFARLLKDQVPVDTIG